MFWWANIVYNIMWFIGSTFYYIFQCSPPSYYWTRLYPVYHLKGPYAKGECDPLGIHGIVIPLIFGLVADVALVILPVFSLARLHMSMRRKAALTVLFSFGVVYVAGPAF